MSSKYANCPSYPELVKASEAMTPVAKRYYALMEKVKQEYSTGEYVDKRIAIDTVAVPVIEVAEPIEVEVEVPEPEVALAEPVDFFDNEDLPATIRESIEDLIAGADLVDEIDDQEEVDIDEIHETAEMIGVVVDDNLPISELLDLSDQPEEPVDFSIIDLVPQIAQDGRLSDPGTYPSPEEKPGSEAHAAPTGLVNTGTYPDGFDPAELDDLDSPDDDENDSVDLD